MVDDKKNDGIIAWGEDALNKLGGMPARFDGWVNVLTGYGNASRDKRLAATYRRTNRVTFDREGLSELYGSDDLAANIVDIPAEEAVREWFELHIQEEDGDADPETASGVMQELDVLGAQEALGDAIAWARLYGGSLILLGADDGQEVDQPLNMDSIRSLDWITVLDRFDVEVESFYTDPMSDKFGLPEFYRLTGSTDIQSGGQSVPFEFNSVVHESRTIRFDGSRTTRRRKRENQGWADSVMERMLDVVRDYQATQQGVAHLLITFSQAVFKIKDLAKALASDADNLVLKRLTLLDMARSIVKAVPLDAEHEEYENKGAAVTGMADLVDRQMMRVSSAARIPVTLLFGRSPAGLNATGESDIRLFYDRVAAFQEIQLRPRIEYLLTVLMNAQDGPTSGVEPESWSFDFIPLYQESSKEKAETRKLIAEADVSYKNAGILSADEIAMSRFGGDDYSPETQLDKEQREKDRQEEERLRAEMMANPQMFAQQNQPPQTDPETGDPAQDPQGQEQPPRREDAKSDAPDYRPASEDEIQSGETCRTCAFANGMLCQRFDFGYERGWRCDDFLSRRQVLIGLDKKDRRGKKKRKRGRRRNGRNY